MPFFIVHRRISSSGASRKYWQKRTDIQPCICLLYTSMSFLRLKNLERGYTLPQRWTTKIGIRGCRLFARGTNLLTFSNFKLWDPELATTDGDVYKRQSQKVIRVMFIS